VVGSQRRQERQREHHQRRKSSKNSHGFLIRKYNGLTKHTGCQRVIRRGRTGHRVEAQLAILSRLILLQRKKRIRLTPSSHINLPVERYSILQGKTHFRNNRWEMENGAFKIHGVHAKETECIEKVENVINVATYRLTYQCAAAVLCQAETTRANRCSGRDPLLVCRVVPQRDTRAGRKRQRFEVLACLEPESF
jgi:hypothetical protein